MFPAMKIYDGNGTNIIWPIPFLFDSPGEVGARLQTADGLERSLVQGVEFVISDNRVVCPVAAGDKLILYYDMGGQARQAGPAPQVQTLQAPQMRAQDLSDDVMDETEARISRIVDEAIERLTAFCGTLNARAGQFLEEKRREVERELKICASPLPQEQSFRAGLVEAGSLLHLPLAYVPGSGTLSLVKNGLVQIPELDFRECEGNLAQDVLLLKPCVANDVWLVRVASVSSTANAARAAAEAAWFQKKSAELVGQSGKSADEARRFAQDARAERTRLAQFAEDARAAANEAHKSACRVLDAASQVSIHARRPGISAVRSLAELAHAHPGVYIVNPQITHSPTLFMGIWPAESVADMQWDGVFFIGKPYPKDPALPPACPPHASHCPGGNAGGDADGTGEYWLPCDHTHNEKQRPCCHPGPARPHRPAKPDEPQDPDDPKDPDDPIDPDDPQEPIDPVDPNDPVDPKDPQEPEEPIDPEEDPEEEPVSS